jgi:hypothetical protein
VCTIVAPDACEAVLQYAAREELLRNLRDHWAPRAVLAGEAVIVDRLQAVQMVLHQPKEWRRLGPTGFVDATRRRGRVGHARSGTGERRAYSRLGCGPSPCSCATGRFDATSAWLWSNGACCRSQRYADHLGIREDNRCFTPAPPARLSQLRCRIVQEHPTPIRSVSIC